MRYFAGDRLDEVRCHIEESSLLCICLVNERIPRVSYQFVLQRIVLVKFKFVPAAGDPVTARSTQMHRIMHMGSGANRGD